MTHTQFALDQNRLALIVNQGLKRGSHARPEDGCCLLEAEAFIYHRPHSDSDANVCPVIRALCIPWNDAIDGDDPRTELFKPFLGRLMGTKSTAAVTQRRADILLDWVTRVDGPNLLEQFGHKDLQHHVAKLRALAPLFSPAARKAAKAAADALASDAAGVWAGVWAGVRAGVRAGVWAGVRAGVRDGVRDGVWAGVWDGVWDGVWAGVWAGVRAGVEKLAADQNKAISDLTYGDVYNVTKHACVALFAPTRGTVERSALDLLEQLLAVTPESLSAEKDAPRVETRMSRATSGGTMSDENQVEETKTEPPAEEQQSVDQADGAGDEKKDEPPADDAA